MELLRFDNLVVVPWKNGGGLTRELAVHLDGEIHPEFLWRISMATVAGPGPFSRFDGIDRTIAVLQGEGIVLASRDNEIALRRNSDPYSFAGETPIDALVVSGETTDLNVMTRRGYFTHVMKRVVIREPLAIEVQCDEMMIVFNGEADVEASESRLSARPLDTLTGLKRGTRLRLLPSAGEEIFLIELSRASA
nr:HutD family protein [Rhizobium sp. ACO-34A]